jgi:hypothetical protein
MLLWLSILLQFLYSRRTEILSFCWSLITELLWALFTLYVAMIGMERTFGAWLSLVERTVRDREVGGSTPLAPTILFSQLW